MWGGGGAEGKGEREFWADSAHSTQPDLGAWSHNPEIMIWAETKSQMLNQLSHPGTPSYYFDEIWVSQLNGDVKIWQGSDKSLQCLRDYIQWPNWHIKR